MADLDLMGQLVWRVARMRDLQRKADKLRPWEAADLLELERDVDKLTDAYFLEGFTPAPENTTGGKPT